jgi:hypothetical protein
VLADHIVVDGADLQNGLLHVGLKRVVPEALKPRRITIGAGAPTATANDAQDSRLPDTVNGTPQKRFSREQPLATSPIPSFRGPNR